MHFVDLALVNSWILYQRDAKVLKIPRKDVYQFLAFKLDVAQTYLAAADEAVHKPSHVAAVAELPVVESEYMA